MVRLLLISYNQLTKECSRGLAYYICLFVISIAVMLCSTLHWTTHIYSLSNVFIMYVHRVHDESSCHRIKTIIYSALESQASHNYVKHPFVPDASPTSGPCEAHRTRARFPGVYKYFRLHVATPRPLGIRAYRTQLGRG